MELYHGSPVPVERPQFGVGSPYNDYGLGFYCTEDKGLAAEWACPQYKNGFVNKYGLELPGLVVFDLDGAEGGILAWLAVLLRNRRFDVSVPVMQQAKDVILSYYPAGLDTADVIMGYRADDAYFSFAKAFLDNRITLAQLERAMKLGNLGRQVVLKSRRAFDEISFLEVSEAPAETWHEKRMARDADARTEYKSMLASADVKSDDVFAIDLVREALHGTL